MPGEHFIVIGGTTGSGRALVRLLSQQQHDVSVIGRRTPVETDRDLPGVQFHTADLMDDPATRGAIEACVARFGRVNHLVFFQRYRGKDDPWQGEIAVSLTATKTVIEACVGHFPISGNNAIVVVGSNASRFVCAEQGVGYHAVKAALEQIVRYYAVTLGPKGVRVNCVTPDTVIKEESQKYYEENAELCKLYDSIIPLGRMGTSADVANAIDFLCSPRASFITGQNLIIDGGLSLLGQAPLARRMAGLDALKLTR